MYTEKKVLQQTPYLLLIFIFFLFFFKLFFSLGKKRGPIELLLVLQLFLVSRLTFPQSMLKTSTEQALSMKTIHYFSIQIAWECYSKMATDFSSPNPFPPATVGFSGSK